MTVAPLHLLLVEDNPGDADLVQERLADATSFPFEMARANQLVEAIQRVQKESFDTVLLDLSLPDSRGLDTVRGMRRACPDAPLVVLTGINDEELGLEAIRKGAQDYLTKGQMSGSSLARAIRYAIERKRAEREIQKLNQELESRVAKRTAQLEASLKELEAFTYSVSHDLRAPLRGMDGFAKIVLEDRATSLSDEARHCLQRIRENAQLMGRLVDGLLALSRLNKQGLQIVIVDPIDLIQRALEDLRSERAGRQIEIVIGDLPVCRADPVLLKQVFLNLLDNALKFTRGRDGARIEVGSRGDAEQPGRRVYFVRDNGVGFDMRYAHKLFGVFQRLHRAEDYEGTGVGLAIVQRIIHRHGGRVWAEAQPDRGATFYFTLGGGPVHD